MLTLVLWLLPELTVIVAGGGGVPITREIVFEAETAGVAESVTIMTTGNVPLAVGAPEMMPVPAAIVKPPGKPVADQL